MTLTTAKEQNIIERDLYCPFCQNEKALLISELSDKRSSIGAPALGLKYLLSVLFTFGLHMITHGFPWIEKKRTFEYSTYGFCPCCGKSYNASAPNHVKTTGENAKFYKSVHNKKIMGICGGIANYTGLPIMLVRIVMVVNAPMYALPYLICGLVLDSNPNQ